MNEPKPIVEVTVRKDLYSDPSIEALEKEIADARSAGHTVVGLEIEESYENSQHIVLVSRRPETPYERDEREVLARRRAHAEEVRERKLYEVLKGRFEGKK